jgi:hypothetical protein
MWAVAPVATNHTRLADAKQRPGKQRLLGNNLVGVNRALANHGLGTSQCLATAVYIAVATRQRGGGGKGLLGRLISSSQGLYLNTGQHKHRINT